jgi:chromosome segregation ATPase
MNLQTELLNEKAKTAQLAAKIAELEALIAATPKAEDAIAAATVSLNETLATVRSELITAQSEIVSLKAELKDAQDITDAKVSAKAQEIAASQGNVPPIALKPVKDPQNSKQLSVVEQFNALSDPRERAKFYDEHKDELLK